MIRVLVTAAVLLGFGPVWGFAQSEQERDALHRVPRDRAERRADERTAPSRSAHLGVTLRTGAADAAVQVEGVSPKSAAERAGLLSGDRILAFDGRPMPSAQALSDAVRGRRPRDEVTLLVRRVVSLELDGAKRTRDGRLALGAYLDDDPQRLTIARLAPDHPAAAAGLLPGDRIVAVDGAAVQREADLAERMRAIGEPRAMELALERELRVRLGEAPSESGAQVRAPALADERALLEQVRALREEIEQLRREVERLRRELARSQVR